jgi:tetratricopeptide (TPR) repeat protein
MFDPRAMEASSAALLQAIEARGLSDPDQINAYLEEIRESGDLPQFEPHTPLERAQALIYEAALSANSGRRVKLAKKALKICSDCADAYVILAEEDSKSLGDALARYRAGVEAGERALGPDMLSEYSGEFWSNLETRPYMRALKGVAECQAQLGRHEEAVKIFRRLLELNPGDNQGTRYLLLASLLEMGDTKGARILLRTYQDDIAASWAYGRALVTFLERGNSKQARAQLQEALMRNISFAVYLLGVAPLPEELPEYMEFGSESEGVECFMEQGNAWLQHPDAMDWMVDTITRLAPAP